MNGTRKSAEERFWSKVEKTDTCWLWTAGKNDKGYGQFSVGGKTVRATRFSFELAHGASDKTLFLCHKCDEPSCVRPDHLFLGTHLDNMRDMREKGRSQKTNGGFRGETLGTHKLLEVDVHEIRRGYASGTSVMQLAERFGVSEGPIYAILRGKRWRHVVTKDVRVELSKAKAKKLTPNDVDAIRLLIADGENFTFIARQFGVSQSTISRINSGKLWKRAIDTDQEQGAILADNEGDER